MTPEIERLVEAAWEMVASGPPSLPSSWMADLTRRCACCHVNDFSRNLRNPDSHRDACRWARLARALAAVEEDSSG